MPSIKPNVLRNLRRRIHLSQEEVAGRAGITSSYLSRLETAPQNENPSDDVIVMLARVFAVPPSDLYDLELANVAQEELHQAIRKMELAEIIAIRYSVNEEFAAYLAQTEDDNIRAKIALEQLESKAGGRPFYHRSSQKS